MGFAAAAALLAAVQANADPTQVRTNPDWLRKPTGQDISGVWPSEAMRRRIGGAVRLKCEVDTDGLLQLCSVDAEDPPGMGFASAALALTPKFLFRPAKMDGKPVSAWVVIPIKFSMENAAPPPTGTPASGSPAKKPVGEEFYLLPSVPWDRAPTAAQLTAAYPRQAGSGPASGHVVLACAFSKVGDLKDCKTEVEEPELRGFGAAAKSLLPLFHLDPADVVDADITKIHVNLAIHFTPGGPDPNRMIDQPDWISVAEPSGDLFPEKAARAGLKTGRAVLNCAADAEGRMTGCQVASEDPAGMDFGPAAVKTTASVRINRWGANGQPADGAHVVFAVRVNKDEPEDAAKGP